MAEAPEGESAVAERGFLPHRSKGWDDSPFLLPSSPSQPPDIGNWFSSYAYESPESLGLPYGVGSADMLQEEDGETQLPMEISSGEERALCDVPENGKRKLDPLMSDENHYRAIDDFSGDFGLLGAKKCLIEGSASSPERSRSLPRMNNKKQVSHQDHPSGFNFQEQQDESEDDSRMSSISRTLSMEQKDCSIRKTNTGNKPKPKVSLRKLLDEELLASGAEENYRCPSKDIPCTTSVHLEGIKDGERIDRRDWIPDEAKYTGRFISIKGKGKCRGGGHDLSQQQIPTLNYGNLILKTEETSEEKHELLSIKPKNGALKEDEQSIRGNRSYQTVEAALEIAGKWQCPHDLSSQSAPTVDFNNVASGTEVTSKETHESSSFKQKNGGLKEDEQPIREHEISLRKRTDCRTVEAAPEIAEKWQGPHESLTFKQKDGALKMDEPSIRENTSPLRDRTNYQTGDVAAEIPGKWQCPRKAKADEGPPMKQLRLDRWFYLLNCNPRIK